LKFYSVSVGCSSLADTGNQGTDCKSSAIQTRLSFRNH